MFDIDELQGWDLAQPESSQESKDAADRASRKLSGAAYQNAVQKDAGHQPDARIRFLQGASEFAGTIAAGITGAVVWGAGVAEARAFGLAGTLGLAIGSAGLVKYGVKSGLEHILLKPEDRVSETKEMLLLEMTGRQLKDALEFGVADLSPAGAVKGNWLQRVHRYLGEPQVTRSADKSGNFLQVSGER